MKRSFLVAVIAFLVSENCIGQILMQDAEGKSSIVSSGGTVNLDILESSIQVNYYRDPLDPNKNLIWGVDLKGESEEGIANLIGKGEFVPKGELSLLLGGKFVGDVSSADNAVVYDGLEGAGELIGLHGERMETLFREEVGSWFKENSDNDSCLDKRLQDEILGIENPLEWGTVILSYADESEKCPVSLGLVESLWNRIEANDSIMMYLEWNRSLNELPDDYEFADEWSWRISPFGRAGANVMEFKYDRGNDIADFESRFQDTVHAGLFVEGGLSVRLKRWYLGLATGYQWAHNFSALKKKEYKYTVEDTTISSGSLKSSEDVKAYSGTYGRYHNGYVRFDAMRVIEIADSKFLGLGVYLRNNISFNSKLIRGNTVMGVAFNFLDTGAGKFLGGIYVESQDISGRLQPNFRKSIQFGLVTRMSFAGTPLPQ